MLGLRFCPRIRGVQHQRIYRIDPNRDYGSLASLIVRVRLNTPRTAPTGGGGQLANSVDLTISQSRQNQAKIVADRDFKPAAGFVLPGLADFPINRIAELTPGAWAARN